MTSKAFALGVFSAQERMPLKRTIVGALAGAALALGATPACGTVVYDEGTHGDLSDDGLSPTAISFAPGSNVVMGATGRDTAGVPERDYFTFTIAPNQTLTALNLLEGTQTLGFSFIGLQAGGQVTLPTDAATAAGLVGWAHYGTSDVGTDILDNMSVAANGSSGFSGPLGPGTYSVWVQEISPGGAVPYSFGFNVSSVPEPSTWAMMMLGIGLIGVGARRRRRSTPSAALC